MKPSAEPEDEMVEVGKALLAPPTEDEPLLELLGQVEVLLSKVEQSPQPTMLKALDPVMKGLVANDLLRNSNTDVKVVLASCISEITRITAPEAPYDDELMKTIFELIVEAFGGLNENPQSSQASYTRRLSILETVAKVRSCVVMLDLECDGLILEMFRHFFRARRASHPESAFSLMETIMTVVVEESEDFSSDFVLCLLDSVKRDTEDASRELGENVIGKCGAKLKPYLLKEIQSRGYAFSDYSRVVASVCQKSFDAPDKNELSALDVDDDGKLSERTVSEELQQGSAKVDADGGVEDETGRDKSPEPVVSNGAPMANDAPLADLAPPTIPSEQGLHDEVKDVDASLTSKRDKQGLLDVKADKVQRHSGKKSKGCKNKSLVTAAEISDHSPMDVGKDIEIPDNEENKNSQNEIALDKKLKAAVSLEDDNGAEGRPSKESNVKADSNLEASRPKRGRPLGSKTSAKKGQKDLHASPSIVKEASDRDEDELQKAKGRNKNAKADDAHDSGGKTLKTPSNKKQKVTKESEPLSSDAILKKDEEGKEDVDLRPVKQSGKKNDRAAENEPLKEQIRKGRSHKTGTESEKHATKKEGLMEAISSPDTAGKDNAKKKHDTPDETSTRKRRRKNAQGENEDLDDLDEKLVGSSIKVWWPDDKRYYHGIVNSYDPDSRKHEVLYNDGDKEILLLKDERWEIISSQKGKLVNSGDAEAEGSVPRGPQKKKAKTSSDSASQVKADNTVKKGSSSGKVKGDAKHGSEDMASADNQDVSGVTPETTKKSMDKSGKRTPGKSGKKNKEKPGNETKTDSLDSAQAESRKKDRIPKLKSEIKDGTTPKSGKKAKDADLETDNQAKDVTSPSSKADKKKSGESASEHGGSKTGRKSKSTDTPKSGTKSAVNGTSSKDKSSQKVQGIEDSSPKALEGSKKRGRPSKN